MGRVVRIFYDTEFLENGRTIIPISIGMVAEDGREYYAVNKKLPAAKIRKHPWLMENVVPGLPMLPDGGRNRSPVRDDLDLVDYKDSHMKGLKQIADEVKGFILDTPDVELWAWYGAYDHVALCQLFGPMVALPVGIPMWTNDLRQEVHRIGNPPMPEQARGSHNALWDARHNQAMAWRIDALSGESK